MKLQRAEEQESDFKPPVGRCGAWFRLGLGRTSLSKHKDLARQDQVQLRDVLDISVRACLSSFGSSSCLESPVFINGGRRQRRLPLISHVSWNHRPCFKEPIFFCQEGLFLREKAAYFVLPLPITFPIYHRWSVVCKQVGPGVEIE